MPKRVMRHYTDAEKDRLVAEWRATPVGERTAWYAANNLSSSRLYYWRNRITLPDGTRIEARASRFKTPEPPAPLSQLAPMRKRYFSHEEKAALLWEHEHTPDGEKGRFTSLHQISGTLHKWRLREGIEPKPLPNGEKVMPRRLPETDRKAPYVPHKQYDEAFKLKVLREMEDTSPSFVTRKYGLSSGLVYNWKNRFATANLMAKAGVNLNGTKHAPPPEAEAAINTGLMTLAQASQLPKAETREEKRWMDLAGRALQEVETLRLRIDSMTAGQANIEEMADDMHRLKLLLAETMLALSKTR